MLPGADDRRAASAPEGRPGNSLEPRALSQPPLSEARGGSFKGERFAILGSSAPSSHVTRAAAILGSPRRLLGHVGRGRWRSGGSGAAGG